MSTMSSADVNTALKLETNGMKNAASVNVAEAFIHTLKTAGDPRGLDLEESIEKLLLSDRSGPGEQVIAHLRDMVSELEQRKLALTSVRDLATELFTNGHDKVSVNASDWKKVLGNAAVNSGIGGFTSFALPERSKEHLPWPLQALPALTTWAMAPVYGIARLIEGRNNHPHHILREGLKAAAEVQHQELRGEVVRLADERMNEHDSNQLNTNLDILLRFCTEAFKSVSKEAEMINSGSAKASPDVMFRDALGSSIGRADSAPRFSNEEIESLLEFIDSAYKDQTQGTCIIPQYSITKRIKTAQLQFIAAACAIDPEMRGKVIDLCKGILRIPKPAEDAVVN